ncbi:phytanoyl-CoA dioxygenase domain containing protein, putative [Pediculus humanus corporis]|uniref:Phytanoyl-CoA dioxygenase domain containing protein, putative n=1 Tax=Pediculus humanus subsp. corporis TaxID=121224 RepID=E0V9U6_PEDHC|nr:phytanoyl-CoA dioxygenase domain containing protein, putative [Pediculus humanus corporis]EEB10152.1 phytanoyl-CoA dioxygenase domain containing protein, putative [Pediculus humanus corporis]
MRHVLKMSFTVISHAFSLQTEPHFPFRKNGYLVLEDFFTEEEVREMKDAGTKLTDDIPDESNRIVFTDTVRNKYLLESGDKIKCFFESGALDKNGKLLVDPKHSLNKVGHALHWLHPVFKKYTFCDKIKNLCDKDLDLEDPKVVQSMYIFKNPKIGDEVPYHQDSSYLHTKPENKLVGFWIALDDATVENGCLWFAPGSHKSGVHRRYIRNPDLASDDPLIYTSPQPFYPSSNFIPVPVKKGTLVLIHGLVVHFSESNKSNLSRHVYTFHVVDFDKTVYSKENWLQPTENLPFKSIYENS